MTLVRCTLKNSKFFNNYLLVYLGWGESVVIYFNSAQVQGLNSTIFCMTHSWGRSSEVTGIWSFKRNCWEKVVKLCVHAKLLQLCLTLWTVAHQAPLSMGISQARILEWVAMPSSRVSSQPRDQIHVSYVKSPALACGFFITSPTSETEFPCWVYD